MTMKTSVSSFGKFKIVKITLLAIACVSTGNSATYTGVIAGWGAPRVNPDDGNLYAAVAFYGNGLGWSSELTWSQINSTLPTVEFSYEDVSYSAVMAPIGTPDLLSWMTSEFTSVDGNFIAWTGNYAQNGVVYAGSQLGDFSWLNEETTGGGRVTVASTTGQPGDQFGMALLGSNLSASGYGFYSSGTTEGVGWSIAKLTATSASVSAIPEPGSALALAGLLGGGMFLRRRKGRVG